MSIFDVTFFELEILNFSQFNEEVCCRRRRRRTVCQQRRNVNEAASAFWPPHRVVSQHPCHPPPPKSNNNRKKSCPRAGHSKAETPAERWMSFRCLRTRTSTLRKIFGHKKCLRYRKENLNMRV